jgi:phosphatidylserine decarboxylase
MARALLLLGLLHIAFFFFWRFYYFFRNPRRDIPSGNTIVAPADGKIIYVQKVLKGTVPLSIKNHAIQLREIIGFEDFQNHDGYLFGIFLSPFSVHWNRAPITGKVIKRHYVKAPKNLAMAKIGFTTFFGLKPYEQGSEYMVRNERNTLVIQGEYLSVAVVQIADAWINRIDCHAGEGKHLRKGEQFGLIRMGSQVDLFVPAVESLHVRIMVGSRVLAGETVLASF